MTARKCSDVSRLMRDEEAVHPLGLITREPRCESGFRYQGQVHRSVCSTGVPNINADSWLA